MSTLTKVSIIVPVYNTEKYLRKCLDSLLNQSLKEIEILVINDGSSDGSQEIINQYVEKFPTKIKGYTKPNGGLSDARNFGIDRSMGEFIGFVDSDDYVSETMFSEMYDLAQMNRAQMVICNLRKVDEHGKTIRLLPQIPNMPQSIVLKDHFSIFADMSYFACNKIFSRQLFQDKRFKIGVHFEDIQLIPQLLLKCTVVAQTQKYHYSYLERTDSITKTHTENGLDILHAVEDVTVALNTSPYKNQQKELKDFKILEGVYTFLAYLAFVKDEAMHQKMSDRLKEFIVKNEIKLTEILAYKRFGKNYLLSLPLRKKIYYVLYIFGMGKLLRKLL